MFEISSVLVYANLSENLRIAQKFSILKSLPDDDPIPFTSRRSITGSVSYNYAEQIAERRRVEQQQEDRERQEMLEVERQRRVLEDRRNSEEEIRKQAELDRVEVIRGGLWVTVARFFLQ